MSLASDFGRHDAMDSPSIRVSIITPSYNQANYLEQTIQSVLAQDYPQLEYIIIDGASTDGSVEIIRRYADRLAYWVSEPDRGQAEAINKGFQRASGDVVAWLNSDDIYLPGAVARAVAALAADPGLGFVYGDALTIDAQGRPLHPLVFGNWGLEELIRFRIICQPAVFMRRSALEQAGYLDAAYHMMLDHQLWIRLAQRAPIRYLGEAGRFVPLAAARHHPAAKNAAQPEKFAQETLGVLQWMHTQPDLQARLARSRRQVYGGAYRLAARYLLEGGAYARALAAYSRAFVTWPSYTIKHWHRILYAALSLVGFGSLMDRVRQRNAVRRQAQLIAKLRGLATESTDEFVSSAWMGWPGLCLD